MQFLDCTMDLLILKLRREAAASEGMLGLCTWSELTGGHTRTLGDESFLRPH